MLFSKHHRANEPTNHRTVIIGGGIAGLTVAFNLKSAGHSVLLLEQSSSVGGCIKTIDRNGFKLEVGPNTFLNSSAELWKLAEDAGLKDEKVETPKKISSTRYIFKDNKLRRVPAGPMLLLSPLLSVCGRLRILAEPFINPPSPPFNKGGNFSAPLPNKGEMLCAPPFEKGGNFSVPPFEKGGSGGILPDESLATFISRRLGKEVLDTLVTPFVSGIHAGDPALLSAKATFPKLVEAEQKYGGIFKGMKALKGDLKATGLGSFKGGIGELATALERRLGDSIIKNARVMSVEKVNHSYKITFEEDGLVNHIVSSSVVVALPAYAAAKALEGISDELGHTLSRIEYAPIVVIHAGYKSEDIPRRLDGFGYLVPRRQLVRTLGCLFSSALFPGRAPEGHELLTCFAGGMLDPEAADLTDGDLLRLVQADLAKTLGIKSAPVFTNITRYTHAIPQYHIGHLKRIGRINGLLEKLPGLFITGSYFDGISVADTASHANRVATAVIAHLRKSPF